jgi:membrane-bound lytic murein transglycosylase F
MMSLMKALPGTLALMVMSALAGCGPGTVSMPDQTKELVVGVRNSPTTYYTDREGQPAGFEYDLAARFAEKNGWSLRLVNADDLDALFSLVREGRVHLAAAGLTATEDRKRRMSFGPGYGRVEEWVVCNAKGRVPRTLADIKELRLEVVAGSSHEDHLAEQRARVPGLKWVAMRAPGPEELLVRVDLGLSDCTVSDSDSLAVAHNFHPNLQDAILLRGGQTQAWAMRLGVDVRFARKVTQFFREMEKSGELAKLRERYFGHVTRLADADVLGILERRATLLPELLPNFQAAQQETGIDWRLLAAIAYQESQWDAHAVSPTGVRGIMMLTENTADHLGVKNRLDAKESIHGGARYIVQLRDGLAEEILEPDRTWFALAAYNIGPGHLEDARILARRLGKNPNAWLDMKNILPLLSRTQHNRKLRYGYARGGEARAFAENVRIYNDILSRYEKPHRDFWSFDMSGGDHMAVMGP